MLLAMRSLFVLALLGLASLAGAQVVVYTSVDEPVARPIMTRFEKESGIKVKLVTDAEASKTAGLAARLEAERKNPRCDVYWGNELSYTLNLAKQGVFAAYRSPAADDIPAAWRSRDDLFTCIALRQRWLVVSTRPEAADAVSRITSIADLAAPALKGKIGICHPGFGTTSGHVAALYTRLGDERFAALMQSLRANDIKVLGGNAAVVREVAAGHLLAGITDNDDVMNGAAEGMKVRGFPLSGDEGLLVPTAVALVQGAPNADAAEKLIDFLLTPAVEKEMIAARYSALSVRDPKVKETPADYEAAAETLRPAIEKSLQILQSR
jgi:iron(III) transport system substrate-binding protein